MSEANEISAVAGDGRWLSPRFDRAVQFAHALHRDQRRKGAPIPYVSHLFAVAGLVIEHGGTEDEAIAALLHDAIEDQGPKYPGGSDALRVEIERQFGPAVLEIVNGCTDSASDPKAYWPDRKAAYIEHLREKASPSLLLVAAADKVHNARCLLTDYRSIGEAVWERFNPECGGSAGQLWYYGEVAEVFRKRGPRPLGYELHCAIRDLRALIHGPTSYEPTPDGGFVIMGLG